MADKKVIILELTVEDLKTKKTLGEIKKELATLQKDYTEIKPGPEFSKESKKIEAQIRNRAKAVKELTVDYNAAKKGVELLAGSELELIERNKVLTEQSRNLRVFGSDALAEDIELAKKLNDEIKQNNALLKEVGSARGVETRRVGSYVDALGEYFEKLKDEKDRIKNTIEDLGGLGKGFTDLAKGGLSLSAALKTVKLAIAATGIGALVIVVSSLVAFFSSSAKGAEFLGAKLAGLTAYVEVLTQAFSELGEEFFDIWSDENVKKVTDAQGKVLEESKGFWQKMHETALKIGGGIYGFISGEANSAIKELNKKANEAQKAAEERQAKVYELQKREIELNKKVAKSRADIEQNKLTSEDVTKTYEVRIAAAKKAFATEQSIVNEQIALQAKLSEAEKKRIIGAKKQSDLSVDELRQIAELEINIYKLKEEQAAKSTELQNKITSIKQEQVDSEEELFQQRLENESKFITDEFELKKIALVNAEKAAEDQLKPDQYRAQKIVELQIKLATDLEKLEKEQQDARLLALQKASNDYIQKLSEIYKTRIDLEKQFGLIAEETQQQIYEKQLKDLSDAFDKEIDLRKSNNEDVADLEVEKQQQLNFLKIKQSDDFKKYSEAEADATKKQAEKQLELQKNIEDQIKDLKQKARDEAINQLRNFFENQTKAEIEAIEKAKEAREADLENRKNEASEIEKQIEKSTGYRKKALQKELKENQKKQAADIESIKAQEQAAVDAKREGFEKQKEISLALVAIDLGKALSAIFLTAREIDAVSLGLGGVPYQAIQTGLALGNAAIQVTQIESQKFATGGVVGGNSPEGDKIPILVNSGEAVLNKKQIANVGESVLANAGVPGFNKISNFEFEKKQQPITVVVEWAAVEVRKGLQNLTKIENARKV